MLETGCIPLTERQRRRQDAVCASSNPFSIEYAWAARGEMPVLRWSDDFQEYLENRAFLRERYEAASISLNPWDILTRLKPEQKKNDILYWNQGSRPSCSCHGAAHAFQAEQLIQIAIGAPIVYDAVNPIYSFFRGRGGNYGGGLDVLTTSEEINQTGFFPVSAVGKDNISVTAEGLKKIDVAKNYQAGIVRIESDFAEKIFLVCAGLGAVAFASSIYYTSAREDSNGLRVMNAVARGGHMQAFHSYKVVDGKEYIWNQNSHGDIYGTSCGEPESGAWVDRKTVQRYVDAGMENYGYPLCIYSEGDLGGRRR